MFELKDLPSIETLSQFARQYPNPDIEGLHTWLFMASSTSEMMAAFEANLARHGLSQTKFFVLLLLKRSPLGVSIGKLANGVGVSSPTMTGMVERMQQAGLCRREQDPDDRRTWTVRLLAGGDALLSIVLPDHYKWVGDVMSALDDLERIQLKQLIAKLSASVAQVSKNLKQK